MPEDSLPDIVTRLTGDVSGLAASFAEGKALAKAYREEVAGQFTGGKGIGAGFGRDVTDGIRDALPGSLPELIPSSPAEPPGPRREGKKSGDAFVSAFTASMRDTLNPSSVIDDNLVAGLGAKGKGTGDKFAFGFGAGVKQRLQAEGVASIVDGLAPAATQGGERAGVDFMKTMGDQVRGRLPFEVEAPIEESGRKAGDRAGKAAGGAAAKGISPLILGAFAAAASAGPGLILGATATAVIGVEALAVRSNIALRAGLQQLGVDGANAIHQATEPLIPQMQAAVTVLDQGIARIGPELKGTFAAVAPDVTAITGGLVSLVEDTLPGVNSGLRSIAPYAKELGDDFGKIGTGIGGLFAGLGAGANGGTAGFTALATAVEHLLPDIGQIVGDLSGGLGPALHDTVAVLDAAGTGFKFLADNLPAGAIRGTADAVGVLYAAFKIGTLTKVVAEGTTFTQWLGLAKTEATAATTEVAALGVAEEATAAKGGLMAAAGGLGGKAIGGLGAAASLATGPLGLIIGGAGLLGNELGKLAGVGEHVTLDLDQFASTLSNAADGSYIAQQNINVLAKVVDFMHVSTGAGADSLARMDSALTQLYQTNPAMAARDFQSLSNAFDSDGKSASDVAKMFPGYTQAVKDAAMAAKSAGAASAAALGPAQAFTQSIIAQQMKIASSGKDAGVTQVALLDLGVTQTGLSSALADSINDYQGATGAASAYDQALQSLNGSVMTLDNAEAGFTIALDNVTKAAQANGRSLDVTDVKGAQNIQAFTGVAQAADKAAVALYQSEVSTKGANVAFADANGKLLAEKSAFETAAIKAGFNKTQVDSLADSLFKLPRDIPIDTTLNTAPAIASANNLVRYIDSLTGTITVQTGSGTGRGSSTSGATYNPKSGGGKALYDYGGWTRAAVGQPEDAVVHGGEYVLSRDMLSGRSAVDARVLAALRGGGYGGGGQAAGYAPGGGTVVNIYVQAGTVLSSTIQFQQAVTAALAQQGLRMSNQNLSVQSVRGLKSA